MAWMRISDKIGKWGYESARDLNTYVSDSDYLTHNLIDAQTESAETVE